MLKDNLITVTQLAEMLQVPQSWLYSRTRMGQSGIPHIKVGKYVRFNPEEVIKFLKSDQNKV